ncbi:hypothetical protein F0562_002230 [Nyssa sinensis]|uniref:RIN4 pathogenic type III effector avirulence factor Avr cleavage site domain-containing protein n=1 Tax=Nyssa sinensis TaxID=561372 RepID=A0A5J5C6E7_9ASTE|nr:hypothetical protein F0562_002230 [Nyssa sinensis]
MEDFRRSHVPAFGSWDCTDGGLPFTQFFESAAQPGLLRHSCSEDRDLYVAGDLYENDVVTPAMIAVPRRRAKAHYRHVEEAKKEAWEVKETPSPVSRRRPSTQAAKALDEDLYSISPELLRSKSKVKRVLGFFSSCFLLPTSGL